MNLRPNQIYVSVALLSLPIVMIIVNLVVSRSAYNSSITFFAIGLLPTAFLLYRLLYADKVARIIVSILSIGAVYIVYAYVQIFFAEVPGDPTSISHRALMQLKTPSKMLPVLVPALAFLAGVVLLYTPTMQAWFSNKPKTLRSPEK